MTPQFIAEPGKQELSFGGEFDAPPSSLWRAYTDPAIVPYWVGPKMFKNVVDRMDVRVGGMWRFVHSNPDGIEYAFHGIYHLLDEPRQLVFTLEFEGLPGHVLLDTVTFKDLGNGKTLLTDQSVFQSVKDRDGMVAGGMKQATFDGLKQLEELIKNKKI